MSSLIKKKSARADKTLGLFIQTTKESVPVVKGKLMMGIIK